MEARLRVPSRSVLLLVIAVSSCSGGDDAATTGADAATEVALGETSVATLDDIVSERDDGRASDHDDGPERDDLRAYTDGEYDAAAETSPDAGTVSVGDGAVPGSPDAPAETGVEAGSLPLCGRLRNHRDLSLEVTTSYELAVIRDCRVRWVALRYIELDKREQFTNGLIRWNQGFWGCLSERPTDFGLLYEPAPLSASEAETLIGHYLTATDDALRLSPGERVGIHAALWALAAPLVAAEADAGSHVGCPGDAGSDRANDDGAARDDDGAARDDDGAARDDDGAARDDDGAARDDEPPSVELADSAAGANDATAHGD